MKISAAQVAAFKGDIDKNIAQHKKCIAAATAQGAGLIMFPELSLTGYEPTLAQELAAADHSRSLSELQAIADRDKITICAGLPVAAPDGVRIGMLIFRPGMDTYTYTKQFLHESEVPYFVPGGAHAAFDLDPQHRFTPAICYELSVPEHAATAFQQGSGIYAAGVCNSVSGVDKDLNLLEGIAARYGMHVLMANFVGETGEYDCAGQTSVWNREGRLLARLGYDVQGILTLDTEQDTVTETIF